MSQVVSTVLLRPHEGYGPRSPDGKEDTMNKNLEAFQPNICPRCASPRLCTTVHGLPEFSEFVQTKVWAARDISGVWHYRTVEPDYAAESLDFSSFLGDIDGEIFDFAGCTIAFGDETVYLNHSCRDCGLRFGYSEDERCDEFDVQDE